MRLAGFRDNGLLLWLSGQGFPKSTDVSKMIDKAAKVKRQVVGHNPNRRPAHRKGARGFDLALGTESLQEMSITAPATPLAKTWDGWKYGRQSLKPMCEPILLMNKQYEGRPIDCITEHGAGALNVDGCRVGMAEVGARSTNKDGVARRNLSFGMQEFEGNPRCGRFPTNVLFSHSPGCVQSGVRRIQGATAFRDKSGGKNIFSNADKPLMSNMSYADPDGLESVAKWECVEGCPVRLLDEMSGQLKSGKLLTHHHRGGSGLAGTNTFSIRDRTGEPCNFGGDQGTASRYFYQAKASRGEREAGLRGKLPCVKCGELNSTHHIDDKGRTVKCVRNSHPTVKPIGITEYLARLLLPPEEYRDDAAILICFSGTGSEVIGAIKAGWKNWLAIEMDEGMCEIARARIGHWTRQARLI